MGWEPLLVEYLVLVAVELGPQLEPLFHLQPSLRPLALSSQVEQVPKVALVRLRPHPRPQEGTSSPSKLLSSARARLVVGDLEDVEH